MIQKNVHREREEDFNYGSAGYKQRVQNELIAEQNSGIFLYKPKGY